LSLPSIVAQLQYTVTVLPQTFATFAFNLPGDLLVTDGADVLVLGSDYSVLGGGYNSANQLQSGTITVNGTGGNAVQVGDVITISRNITPVQETTFASTGLQTPLMIEADDDNLTAQIQQLASKYYNPFPPVGGAFNVITLGWITAQSGGIRTSIDSLNVVNVRAFFLPLFIAVSIGDDFEVYKLRPMQAGDPSVTTLPFFIVPVINPNSLIWVRVL